LNLPCDSDGDNCESNCVSIGGLNLEVAFTG